MPNPFHAAILPALNSLEVDDVERCLLDIVHARISLSGKAMLAINRLCYPNLTAVFASRLQGRQLAWCMILSDVARWVYIKNRNLWPASAIGCIRRQSFALAMLHELRRRYPQPKTYEIMQLMDVERPKGFRF